MELSKPNLPIDVAEWNSLLAGARRGCTASLGRLLDAYRPLLLQIAGEELASDLQAKAGGSDIVQQTFLDAVQDFPDFQGSSSAELMAWLRQVLRHNLVGFAQYYRGRQKRTVKREVVLPSEGVELEPQATGRSPSSECVARERDAAVEQALARLPEDYRRVIILHHHEGRSFKDIAPLMERSADAVRKLWFRAIEKLQQELDV